LGRGRVFAHLFDRVGRAACPRTLRSRRRLSERRQLDFRPRLQGDRGSFAEPRPRAECARRPGPQGPRHGDRRQPSRGRLGLHRVPELPRGAGGRYDVRWTVRRLPLDVRQPSVDAEVWRPRVSAPRRDGASLGRRRAAPRQRRRGPARLPGHGRSRDRVRQGDHGRGRTGGQGCAPPADGRDRSVYGGRHCRGRAHGRAAGLQRARSARCRTTSATRRCGGSRPTSKAPTRSGSTPRARSTTCPGTSPTARSASGSTPATGSCPPRTAAAS